MGSQIKMYDYTCKKCGQAFRSCLRHQTLCKLCAEELEAKFSKCTLCGKPLSPVKAGTAAFREVVSSGHRHCRKCANEISAASNGYNKICSCCGKPFAGASSNQSICEACVDTQIKKYSRCTECGKPFSEPPKRDRITVYINAGHRWCAVCAGKMSGESRKGKGEHYNIPKPKKKKPLKMSLADCIREAAKLGVTYGQYVVMMGGGENNAV